MRDDWMTLAQFLTASGLHVQMIGSTVGVTLEMGLLGCGVGDIRNAGSGVQRNRNWVGLVG